MCARGTLVCVTSSDAPPTSRRALRAQAERERAAAAAQRGSADDAQAASAFAAAYEAEARAVGVDRAPEAEPAPVSAPAPVAVPAPVPAPVPASAPVPAADETAATAPEAAPQRVALAWVDPDVIAGRRAPADLAAASSGFVPVLPEIISPRRSAKGALASLAVVVALAGGYTAATQLWTLDSVTPVVTQADDVVAVAAPASQVSWPDDGVAAVGVRGMGHTLASTADATTMASITKLVSVLMVLDQSPLEPGEQGPAREIVYDDRVDYWGFINRGESALDVPVGVTLSQYQLMQGALIASAGNYTKMLTQQHWATDEEFAAAAAEWLAENRLDGLTVVEPTGIDRGNTADAASLIRLASLALADPVVAEIVATERAEIPGIGEIENTNPILGDDGIVGIKTGGLIGSYNLLAAREVTVGETTAYAIAAVLDQPTEGLRGTEAAKLLDQVADELSTPTTLAAGTSIGSVSTAWGTDAEILTAGDAPVILWNEARVEADTVIELGGARDKGDTVGELRLEGPLDSSQTELVLSADLGEPDMWWRFTHPLELWGFVD